MQATENTKMQVQWACGHVLHIRHYLPSCPINIYSTSKPEFQPSGMHCQVPWNPTIATKTPHIMINNIPKSEQNVQDTGRGWQTSSVSRSQKIFKGMDSLVWKQTKGTAWTIVWAWIDTGIIKPESREFRLSKRENAACNRNS